MCTFQHVGDMKPPKSASAHVCACVEAPSVLILSYFIVFNEWIMNGLYTQASDTDAHSPHPTLVVPTVLVSNDEWKV